MMRLLRSGAEVPRCTLLSLTMAGVLAASTACAAPPAPSADPPTSAATVAAPSVTVSPSTATAAEQLPRPDHVVIVIFENKDVNQVLGNHAAPFLNNLAHTGVDFTNARAEVHPSQPNYLALFSGSTQGVTDDSCLRPLSAPNLATQLVTVGRNFVGYSEDLPEPGFTGCTSGGYAQKHAVWAAFTNLPLGAHQPWSAWPSTYTQLPTVAAVIPNLCNDMHDCDVATGDRWLSEHLSDYLAWAGTHNSLRVGEPWTTIGCCTRSRRCTSCPGSATPPTPPRSPTSGPVAETAVRRLSVVHGCSAWSRLRRWR